MGTTRSWLDVLKLAQAAAEHKPTDKEKYTPLFPSTKRKVEFRALLGATIHSDESDEVSLSKLARGLNKAKAALTETEKKESTSYYPLICQVEKIVGFDLTKAHAAELKEPEALALTRRTLKVREDYETMYKEYQEKFFAKLQHVARLQRDFKRLNDEYREERERYTRNPSREVALRLVEPKLAKVERAKEEVRRCNEEVDSITQQLKTIKDIESIMVSLEAAKSKAESAAKKLERYEGELDRAKGAVAQEFGLSSSIRKQDILQVELTKKKEEIEALPYFAHSDRLEKLEQELLFNELPDHVPFEDEYQYKVFVEKDKYIILYRALETLRRFMPFVPGEEFKVMGTGAPSAPAAPEPDFTDVPNVVAVPVSSGAPARSPAVPPWVSPSAPEPEYTSPPVAIVRPEGEEASFTDGVEGQPPAAPPAAPLAFNPHAEGVPHVVPRVEPEPSETAINFSSQVEGRPGADPSAPALPRSGSGLFQEGAAQPPGGAPIDSGVPSVPGRRKS